MRTSLYIAGRLRPSASDRGHRRNPGVVIAVIGVALAVVVMELTLAIVTGFKQQITERIEGLIPAVTVSGNYSPETQAAAEYVTLTPELQQVIESAAPGSTPEVAMQQAAIIKTDNDYATVVFSARQGRHDDFAFERSNVVDGQWPDYAHDPESTNAIAISTNTASTLGLKVGDKVTVAFVGGETMRLRKPVVAAIFATNFGEYDKEMAYASLGMLQHVSAVDSLTGSTINVRGVAIDDSPAVADRLQQAIINAAAMQQLDGVKVVNNVRTTAASYFSWLDLLDTNVVVIFILISVVAAFTLVSSLFIILLERIRMIGVLRAMGMTRSGVRGIFLILAAKIVLTGMVIGNIVGLGVIFSQMLWHWMPLDATMYYLPAVPVEIVWWQFAVLNIAVPVVAWMVLILPATIVARVKPTATMRYE